MILQREDAIEQWRNVMGVTNPAEAAKGTIRNVYGTNIERNAVHGSDGKDTADFEIQYFFSSMEFL
jgi:nucleoside-diphosphate kinase